jgi:hypothetical protein
MLSFHNGFLWGLASFLLNLFFSNFWSIIIVLVVIICVMILFKIKGVKISKIFYIEIPRTIVFGNLNIHVNKKNKRLAYNIWVELSTRKIAIDFDEDNDTIIRLYKSWYSAFSLIREYIKDIGQEKIDSDLRKISLSILNETLRPHLTKYHYRFESWFNNHYTNDKDPQDVQKQYPLYEELVHDVRRVNSECKKYLELLQRIIGIDLD